MTDRVLVELMLGDVKRLSYEQFMLKYEPENKAALRDRTMKLQHMKLKASLGLMKLLGKKKYELMVTMIMADKKFKAYAKRLEIRL